MSAPQERDLRRIPQGEQGGNESPYPGWSLAIATEARIRFPDHEVYSLDVDQFSMVLAKVRREKSALIDVVELRESARKAALKSERGDQHLGLYIASSKLVAARDGKAFSLTECIGDLLMPEIELGLDLYGRGKPLGERQKAVVDKASKLEEDAKGTGKVDPEVALRAFVEGVLDVSIASLSPAELRRFALHIPGIDPDKLLGRIYGK